MIPYGNDYDENGLILNQPITDNVDVWDRRPILQHVRDYARARMVGPHALLGALLVRAIAATPPTVVLPPVIGGRASLNIIVATVGRSGAGKGASDAAARAATNLPAILELPLGSGEGIARTFAPSGKDEDAERLDRAIFTASEIDGMTAIAARKGSTLLSTLRSAWSGETLGAANAQAHTRMNVPAHTYRACLTIGVQPERAEPLLADTAGTAQRIVWLPAADIDAPDIAPPCPPPFTIHRQLPGDVVLVLPPVAVDAMLDHRRAVLRGDSDIDPLDGHKMLTRAKLAAGFMLLDGRLGTITEDDWTLAGWLIRVSDRTRTQIEHELRDVRRRAVRARAADEVEHTAEVTDRRMQRARDGILRWLADGAQLPMNELRKRARSDWREHVSAAVAELVAAGSVIETAAKPYGFRYQLAGPRVHGSTDSENGRSDHISERSTGGSTVDPLRPLSVDPVDLPVDPHNRRSETGGPRGPVDPRAAVCRDCNISLPATAAGDQCDECDGRTTIPARPETGTGRAPVVVHNAAIERRERHPVNRQDTA